MNRTHIISPHVLADAINSLGEIIDTGRIDVQFAPEVAGGIIGVAHELLTDGTDREVAVVHASTYAEAQLAMNKALVGAGYAKRLAVSLP